MQGPDTATRCAGKEEEEWEMITSLAQQLFLKTHSEGMNYVSLVLTPIHRSFDRFIFCAFLDEYSIEHTVVSNDVQIKWITEIFLMMFKIFPYEVVFNV